MVSSTPYNLHPEAVVLHSKRLLRALQKNNTTSVTLAENVENATRLKEIFSNPGESFYKEISLLYALRQAPWDTEALVRLAQPSLFSPEALQMFNTAFDTFFSAVIQQCNGAFVAADDLRVKTGFGYYAKYLTELLMKDVGKKVEFWTAKDMPVTETIFKEMLKHYYLKCWLEKSDLRPMIEYLTLYRPCIFREVFGMLQEEENTTSLVTSFEKITTIPAVFVREAMDMGYKKCIEDGTFTQDTIVEKLKQDVFEITGVDIDTVLQATDMSDMAALGGKLRNFVEQLKKNDARFLIQKTLNKLEGKEPSHVLKYLYPESVKESVHRFGINNRQTLVKTIQTQFKNAWPELKETLAAVDPRMAEVAEQIAEALDQKQQFKFR